MALRQEYLVSCGTTKIAARLGDPAGSASARSAGRRRTD